METARRSFFVVAGVVVALLGVGGGMQPASGVEGAKCTWTFVIVLDPGFSIEGSTGTHYSEKPGVLQCDGAVNGRPITGAGTVSDEGPYGTEDPDSCMTGSEGTGTDRITVPTAEGQQEIVSEFSYTAAKMSNGGPFRGEFKGTRLDGTIELTVLEGDCVTKPITRVKVVGQGLLHD
ncbi:MAG: hypothetical protein ACRDYF_04135 [Acidimicrobiia bacterium]